MTIHLDFVQSYFEYAKNGKIIRRNSDISRLLSITYALYKRGWSIRQYTAQDSTGSDNLALVVMSK